MTIEQSGSCPATSAPSAPMPRQGPRPAATTTRRSARPRTARARRPPRRSRPPHRPARTGPPAMTWRAPLGLLLLAGRRGHAPCRRRRPRPGGGGRAPRRHLAPAAGPLGRARHRGSQDHRLALHRHRLRLPDPRRPSLAGHGAAIGASRGGARPSRPLQPALHHARLDDDVPVRRAGDGGLRRLPRAADGRHAQHRLSAAQRLLLLDLSRGRAAALDRLRDRHGAAPGLVRLHPPLGPRVQLRQAPTSGPRRSPSPNSPWRSRSSSASSSSARQA